MLGMIEMDEKLMEILCCPVCKSDLELQSTTQEGTEILKGSLFCNKCDFSYPIEEGIPNLLPPEYHEKKEWLVEEFSANPYA